MFNRNDKDKLKGREQYVITDVYQEKGDHWVTILKMEQDSFWPKKYPMWPEELIKIPFGVKKDIPKVAVEQNNLDQYF